MVILFKICLCLVDPTALVTFKNFVLTEYTKCIVHVPGHIDHEIWNHL